MCNSYLLGNQPIYGKKLEDVRVQHIRRVGLASPNERADGFNSLSTCMHLEITRNAHMAKPFSVKDVLVNTRHQNIIYFVSCFNFVDMLTLFSIRCFTSVHETCTISKRRFPRIETNTIKPLRCNDPCHNPPPSRCKETFTYEATIAPLPIYIYFACLTSLLDSSFEPGLMCIYIYIYMLTFYERLAGRSGHAQRHTPSRHHLLRRRQL